MINTKKIMKNSLYLYIRMFFLLIITLYSSRLILEELGITDFGIFNLVTGIIMTMSFLNASISLAIQRYLSKDIAQQNIAQLNKTFSAALYIQIATVLIILLIAETIGLWYVNERMQFPESRIFAVNIIYQFTIFSFICSVLQIPFVSLLLAKEQMSIYSYITIGDAILKLTAAFVLPFFLTDKLIVYVGCLSLIAFMSLLTYKLICKRYSPEVHLTKVSDKPYFKELLSFSSWSLIGNLAYIFRIQGTGVILNLFLGASINASYGLALQVHSAANMFVSNFQLAINPQIMQSYAKNEHTQSVFLAYQGSKFSFYLILILALPLLMNTEFILQWWLSKTPPFTMDFVRLLLVTILIDAISQPLMTVIAAVGKIKIYHIVIGGLNLCLLPCAYFLLHLNLNPTSVLYAGILFSVLSLFIRLLFLKKLINISIKPFFTTVLIRIILVLSTIIPIAYAYQDALKAQSVFDLILYSAVILLTAILVIVTLGLNTSEKQFLRSKLRL